MLTQTEKGGLHNPLNTHFFSNISFLPSVWGESRQGLLNNVHCNLLDPHSAWALGANINCANIFLHSLEELGCVSHPIFSLKQIKSKLFFLPFLSTVSHHHLCAILSWSVITGSCWHPYLSDWAFFNKKCIFQWNGKLPTHFRSLRNCQEALNFISYLINENLYLIHGSYYWRSRFWFHYDWAAE